MYVCGTLRERQSVYNVIVSDENSFLLLHVSLSFMPFRNVKMRGTNWSKHASESGSAVYEDSNQMTFFPNLVERIRLIFILSLRGRMKKNVNVISDGKKWCFSYNRVDVGEK
jgi:hypothetical protein